MAASGRLHLDEWYTQREVTHETRRRRTRPTSERARFRSNSNGAMVAFPGAAHATLQ